MAGHNRWTQIKRQKEKTDKAKSKIFGKFSKLITDEAKKAKGNRDAPSLKAAIERARSFNMPNDAIERALKKATEAGAIAMERITYEAYGPGGCAIIVEALTSNRNKAAQEVKHIFSKHGFALANPGSASWAFERKGVEWTPTSTIELGEGDVSLLEQLVEELEDNEEVQEVFTNVE